MKKILFLCGVGIVFWYCSKQKEIDEPQTCSYLSKADVENIQIFPEHHPLNIAVDTCEPDSGQMPLFLFFQKTIRVSRRILEVDYMKALD
jgi:hypothetical protein